MRTCGCDRRLISRTWNRRSIWVTASKQLVVISAALLMKREGTNASTHFKWPFRPLLINKRQNKTPSAYHSYVSKIHPRISFMFVCARVRYWILIVCNVKTEERSCSSDSRFRRELSETTGHRLLGTQRPQMVWLTAWVWFSLTAEFASKTGVGTVGLFLCHNGNGGQDRKR